MKFGETLKKYVEQQPLSWRRHFLAYRALKKKIPKGQTTSEDESLFIQSLDLELQKVSLFYNTREKQLIKQFTFLRNDTKQARTINELLTVFHSLAKQMVAILNFLEMNATGLRKILKKYDKNSSNTITQWYLMSRHSQSGSPLNIYRAQESKLGMASKKVAKILSYLRNKRRMEEKLFEATSAPFQFSRHTPSQVYRACELKLRQEQVMMTPNHQQNVNESMSTAVDIKANQEDAQEGDEGTVHVGTGMVFAPPSMLHASRRHPTSLSSRNLDLGVDKIDSNKQASGQDSPLLQVPIYSIKITPPISIAGLISDQSMICDLYPTRVQGAANLSVYLILLIVFLFSVNYSIIIPSTAYRVHMVQFDGVGNIHELALWNRLSALAVGVMPCASWFSSFYFADAPSGTYKLLLACSIVSLIFGNILYANSVAHTSHNTLGPQGSVGNAYVMIIGRVFCGLAGIHCLGRRYIDCTSPKNRREVSIMFLVAQLSGICAGYLVGSLLPSRFNSTWWFEIYLSSHTASAYLMSTVWTIALGLVLVLLEGLDELQYNVDGISIASFTPSLDSVDDSENRITSFQLDSHFSSASSPSLASHIPSSYAFHGSEEQQKPKNFNVSFHPRNQIHSIERIGSTDSQESLAARNESSPRRAYAARKAYRRVCQWTLFVCYCVIGVLEVATPHVMARRFDSPIHDIALFMLVLSVTVLGTQATAFWSLTTQSIRASNICNLSGILFCGSSLYLFDSFIQMTLTVVLIIFFASQCIHVTTFALSSLSQASSLSALPSPLLEKGRTRASSISNVRNRALPFSSYQHDSHIPPMSGTSRSASNTEVGGIFLSGIAIYQVSLLGRVLGVVLYALVAATHPTNGMSWTVGIIIVGLSLSLLGWICNCKISEPTRRK